DAQPPSVREPAAHGGGAPAPGLDLLGQALAEDPDRPGEVPLRPGQDVVERRELLAVGTADVAVPRTEAVLDVGVDHAATAVQSELLDALRHLVAAGLQALVAVLAVDGKPLAEPAEGLLEFLRVEARVESLGVVPALQGPRWDVVADGVVDHGAAADA